MLRSALEFAKSGSEAGGGAEASMQVDSPCPSPASLTPAHSLSSLAPAAAAPGDPAADPQLEAREDGDSGHSLDTAMEVETAEPVATTAEAAVPTQPPKPRFVSEMEMKVLSSCLGRWIREVDEEIAGLSQCLTAIEGSIAAMYEEAGLRERGYRLHAVMVHEGDVNQGHYWAYVNHAELGWLKFNDNTVSHTTWQEVSKEAVGGSSSTASAYSCVYVDVARNSLFKDASPSLLPTDLDIFVMEDNKSFASEVVKWDEQQHRQKEEEGAGAAATNQPVLIGDDPECQIIEQKPDLAQSHALLARDLTLEYLNIVANEKKKPDATKNNTSNVINKIYAAVKQKIQAGRNEGFGDSQDVRLESFLHYLIANDLTVDHYKKALLEQVALQEFELMSDLGREVSKTAKDSLRTIPSTVEQEIILWHRAYHQFRIVVNYFVLGVEKYTDNMLEEALELFTISYIVNEKIIEDPPQSGCKVSSHKFYLPVLILSITFLLPGNDQARFAEALPPGSGGCERAAGGGVRDRVGPGGRGAAGGRHAGPRHPHPPGQDQQDPGRQGRLPARGGEHCYEVCS